MASKLVTAFISAMHDSIHRRGLPNDITTYGLVSAMYFSANSIGLDYDKLILTKQKLIQMFRAFVGPSFGGFLLEATGYRKATFFILIIDILLV